ncbi:MULTISPECIES: hypothetical protein [unclassified Methylobacterium]|jgi:uncharacterized membrane protein YkvI|uniref:hypothetical protein n=1 Tax=unclassified Methylobacterium TaxID=2615210 RepID=UPI001922CC5D|nr:hypothetical protein [Methylobacterium sp. 2A]
MSSVFGLPLAIATVFTLGGILIQKAGRRAEAVTDGLGVLFLLCALLNAIALLAFFTHARSAIPAPIRSMPDGSIKPAGFAARPILPPSRADGCLKSQANFWNAPCLPEARQQFEG